ncbi:hypothetical protein [Nonomuraea sp. NPDC003804]|uniref:hypothetical protein n=1 Tax=Nonomuraea sp. NPDC003804 TaxID=3154547 RepID=UPI0033A2CBAE
MGGTAGRRLPRRRDHDRSRGHRHGGRRHPLQRVAAGLRPARAGPEEPRRRDDVPGCRATLEVTSPDGRAWATAEGVATLTGPDTDPHGPEVEALVGYYRRAAGEHPDWDEYRSVMVSDRRVLMTMTVDHVYGAEIR